MCTSPKFDVKIMLLLLTLAVIGASIHGQLTFWLNFIGTPRSVPRRLAHHEGVLKGVIEPPYRHRVLAPVAAELLQTILESLGLRGEEKKAQRLTVAYFLIVFVSLALTYGFFHSFLREWFGEREALIGCLLLMAVIPLSITGYFVDDDFVTLALYAVGFRLFIAGRDWLLPLIVFVGTFNREQTIFLVVFWLAYQSGIGNAFRRRTLCLAFCCALAFLIPWVAIRYIQGNPPTRYTVSYHVHHNIEHLGMILRLWSMDVLLFVVLACVGLRHAPRFFRYALATLPVYVTAFFLKGNMWELAKALPMYLILIPLSLFALFPPAESVQQAPVGADPRVSPRKSEET